MAKGILKAVLALIPLVVAGAAMAAQGAPSNEFDMKAYVALAAGLGIGIAAFGGALGQSKAAAAALEGIARNPGAQNKIFTPMLLALAFIESLVIFTWIIEFFLYGKLG
ncbi:MAG: hypothetical protein Kow0090_10230 [Myxococcota bacterium]